MAVTDTRRPASTTTNEESAYATFPSGSTLHARTADQSNSTGARTSPSTHDTQENGTLLEMAMASHTPAAGTERHRIRGRCTVTTTGNEGAFTYLADFRATLVAGTGNGPLVTESVKNRSLSSPLTTAWSSGSGDLDLSGTGAKTFRTRFRATTNNPGNLDLPTVDVTEFWVEIDCRAKPDISDCDVLDGAGVSQNGGDIADTSRARLTFGVFDLIGGANLDGLPVRSWSVTVEEQGTGIVRFSTSGSGLPPGSSGVEEGVILTSPLPVGSYTAKFNLSTTIRNDDAFAADEQEIDFDVSFVATPPTASVPNTVSGLKLHYSALPRKRGERGL